MKPLLLLLTLLALLTACAPRHVTWHATRGGGWVYGAYIIHRSSAPCGQPATYEWFYVTEQFDSATGGWSCVDSDRSADKLRRRVERRMKP